MKFGEKLKGLRQKRKLTQDEVATAIGVSRRAYIAYEQENVRPRKQETYDNLAKTLGCDVNYLRIDDNAFTAGASEALAMLGMVLKCMSVSPIGVAAALPIFAASFGIKAIEKKETKRGEEPKEALTYSNDMFFQYERTQKRFAATAMGILYKTAAEKGIQCQQGSLKDIHGIGIQPDDYIVVKGHVIKDWWIIFWAKDPELDEHIIVSSNDRARAMVSRFTTVESDPKRMATIVVDDIELYEAVCRYKDHNSYRGNLSVVLVDTNEVRICKETIIALYDDEPSAKSGYISIMQGGYHG